MTSILDEAGLALLDEAGGAIGDEAALPPPVLSRAVTCSCRVCVSLAAAVTIGCRTGAPWQGGIRNLAADRWESMYPG